MVPAFYQMVERDIIIADKIGFDDKYIG